MKNPNQWRENFVNNDSYDPKDMNKNYLNQPLQNEGSHSVTTIYHNFKLKIINFVTPSFKLEETIKKV